MKKNLLLITLLFLALGNIIDAKVRATSMKYRRSSRNKVGQIKFGPQIKAGLTSGRIEVFGEYKLKQTTSIQIFLSYSTNTYFLGAIDISNGGSVFVQSDCINIPIILKNYPGNDEQFCFFWGAQLGYLTDGKFKFRDERRLSLDKNSPASMDEFDNIEFIKLKEIDEQEKIRKFQLGIITGFDYQFESGLILGLSYTKELINLIKADESYFNWTFQTSLGYNLSKLF